MQNSSARKAEGEREMQKLFENVACPFCGMLCDDLEVENNDGTLKVLKNGCGRAIGGFERKLPPSTPQIRGKDVTLPEAVKEAAALIGKADSPLFGGLATGVEGMRAALALAERAGGVVDHALSEGQYRNVRVLQSAGWTTSTLTETRNRADLVIIVGSDIRKLHPRFFERIVSPPDSMFEVTAPKRTVVFIGEVPERKDAAGPQVGHVVTLPCKVEQIGEVLGALRARLRGFRLNAKTAGGIALAKIDAVAEMCKQAKYGVMVWAPPALSMPQADLTVQLMTEIVRESQSQPTLCRPVARRQRRRAHGAADLYLADRLPAARQLRQRHARVRFLSLQSRRMLTEGEGDLLLWVASIGTDLRPAADRPADHRARHARGAASATASGVTFLSARPASTTGPDGPLRQRRVAAPEEPASLAASERRHRPGRHRSRPVKPVSPRHDDQADRRQGLRPRQQRQRRGPRHLCRGRTHRCRPLPKARIDKEYDVRGRVVMAGAIDPHTHIGGGKVTIARTLMPEDHEKDEVAHTALTRAGTGHALPSTMITGYRYAEMGYTACFEPAMLPANARQAHMELADTPLLDKGAFVMLGSDDLLLRQIAAKHELRAHQGLYRLDHARRAGDRGQGGQPGGISAFKFNQRKLDLDEKHVYYGITPRDIILTLARGLLGARRHASAARARLQPRHPGQRRDDARDHPRDGRPAAAPDAHPVPQLRHRGRPSLLVRRRADRRARSPSTRTSRSTSARSCSARRARRPATACASTTAPRTPTRSVGWSWTSSATPAAASCPFRYRDKSYVTRCSGRSGSRRSFWCEDPWRIFLTTDHPNGAPFYTYPHLIRLLMDRGFRDDMMQKVNQDALP